MGSLFLFFENGCKFFTFQKTIRPMSKTSLLLPIVFVVFFFSQTLQAQSDLLSQTVQYRETIKSEITNALLYVDAWEGTLSGSDLASKEQAFEELKDAFFLTMLRLANMPVLEGDTSLMKRAGELIMFVEKETRDRLWDVQHYATTPYMYSKENDAKHSDLLANVRTRIKDHLIKVEWAERELMANLIAKPHSAEFCFGVQAMLPEIREEFSNLKGAYIGSNGSGYEAYEAAQLISGALKGQVLLGGPKPYAEFLMAETAEKEKAFSIMNEMAIYVMCCDLKDWRRFGSGTMLNDKAAINGLEFRDPYWAVEIAPVVRQKGASGPYEVYLQFRKLK
jgi:hypothetical protein